MFEDYLRFISNKKHSSINYGIEVNYMANNLFDFQAHIIEYAIKKGRCAIFLDTGLGKTIIELVIAANYVNGTNRKALIITPLAVASQFIKEAEKFGINDVGYSKNGKSDKKIVVCNYERLHYFDSNEYDCVILDESSILKNFDGATKQQITQFMRKVKYRYLATATPSPNDYVELGTSSEALGYLGYTDMLTKFFKNNNNTIKSTAMGRVGDEWYLKPHAENDFWAWVASWSISAKKPSDLGFSDDKHHLPDLIETETIIRNENPLIINGIQTLFALPAQNFFEIKAEVRNTINARCEAAVDKSNKHDISVYWCNLNEEAKIIKEIDSNSHEIRGDMDIDKKEEILLAFSDKQINKLITKTSITAFGLNWQHCNHTTYFPTYSYEQYYQAVRRFWRFGQLKPVYVDLILSDGQEKIIKTLLHKKEKALKMFEKLTQQTNQDFTIKQKEFNQQILLPKFI